MGVSLSVLGPLELAVDGEPVALPPAQATVLAAMTVGSGRPIPTDVLIERVWPQGPPKSARTSLQVHISAIRKVAPNLIESEGGLYRLHPDVTLDVDVFESHVERAENATLEHDWVTAIAECDAALALWRGDPFAELTDDTLSRAEAIRLTERHLEIIEMRLRALATLGRSAEALPEIQYRVTQHPLHERFRYLLMLALYQGGRQVEALRAYQEFRTMLGEEVGIEPDVSLKLLEERILLQDPTLGDPIRLSTPNNLPANPTSFLGRDATFEKITQRLVTARLMTITGGPGFGKTRLAVELGHSLLGSYPGGVWFAGLADARSVEDVSATIAAATVIHDEVTGVHAVARALASRHILLILDNCEHVLGACAAFATAALTEGGNLRIIATSRAALGVDGEQVWQLDPLQVPPITATPVGPAEALASSAVRLFMDRAQAVDRGFILTAESAPDIVRLARQLAGIPLAIELASRWVPALGISEITSMLDPAVADAADDPAHASASLRAAIDWSLALLPEEDRTLTTTTAIFSGPFGLSDVQAICSQDRQTHEFAAAMARVVGSSLLQVDRRPDGSVRYRMLVPIREFLLSAPEPGYDELETRFAHHYLSMAAGWQVDRFTAVVDLSTIDENIENLRAAMDIGLDRDMQNDVARALVPLTSYFHQRYLSSECKTWIERTLTHDLDPPVKASLLRALGSVSEVLGHLDEAEEIFAQAIAIYDTLDDPDGRARCLVSLAGVQSHHGNWAEGRATAEEVHRLVEPTGNQTAIATASYYVGESIGNGGDVPGALPYLVDAADHFESAGQLSRASYVMSTLAVLAVLDDDESTGRSALKRATEISAASSGDYQLVKVLSANALVAAAWGDEREAATTLLDVHLRIERSHPDELRNFLLPATAVLVRGDEWELVAEIVGWVQHHFTRSQAALPIPWARTMDGWSLAAQAALGDSWSDAATRGRMTTIEDLVARTLLALERFS
jgi:predicted ATPase/DNA-binding SARP family transcriptional activator